MKFAFIGQNLLGGGALEVLIESGLVPSVVITREENDYLNKVCLVAERQGLPILTTSNIYRLAGRIKEVAPRIVFCCSWGQRINRDLLDIPEIGWVNLHPSYLPAYRGPRPIEWQLINGEAVGGCTAHFMTEQFDDGPILAQRKIEISLVDNGESMRLKCGNVLGELAIECLDILSQNPTFSGIPQDDAMASYAPPRETARAIDWERSAREVYNQVRGLSPYPCAAFEYQGHSILVAEIAITTYVSSEFDIGRVKLDADGHVLIGTTDYFVRLLKLRINDGDVSELKSILRLV